MPKGSKLRVFSIPRPFFRVRSPTNIHIPHSWHQAPSREPSDLCFQPGEALYWKGKNYKSGIIPTTDITTQVIPFSAGLVVNYLNRGLFLIIPAHGFMIPNSLAQKTKSIKSFFELSPTKRRLHYALDGLPEVCNT